MPHYESEDYDKVQPNGRSEGNISFKEGELLELKEDVFEVEFTGEEIPPPVVDVFQDLNRMHKKYGLDKVKVTPEFMKFRIGFLVEELEEMIEAYNKKDADGFVDAHIDLMVVASGNIDYMRVDAHEAWNQVNNANFQKEVAANPKRAGSGGFDLIKPDGWVAPNHSNNTGILDELFNNEEETFQPVPTLDNSSIIANFKNNATTAKPFVEGVYDISTRLEEILTVRIFSDIEYQMDKMEERYVDFLSRKFDCPKEQIYTTFQRFLDFQKITESRLPISKEDFNKLSGGAVRVFEECIELQRRKSADYSSMNSEIQRADYFVFGLEDIFRMVRQKGLRIRSIIEKLRAGEKLNFEALEDSLIDDMVYSAFAIEYIRGEMPGQTEFIHWKEPEVWNSGNES